MRLHATTCPRHLPNGFLLAIVPKIARVDSSSAGFAASPGLPARPAFAMKRPPANHSGQAEPDWWWIFDPRCSLRARAVLLFGGGAVAFTFLLSWVAGTVFRQQLQEQVGASFEALAFQLTDKLDRAIYERYSDLQLAAALPAIRQAATSPAERRRLLDAVRNGSPDFAWIGFADAAGTIVAASHGWFEGEPAAERTWFRPAQLRPYAGPLREMPSLVTKLGEESDGQPPRFFDLAVPVSDLDGEFCGVLGAQVRWAWAHDVQRSVIPDTAQRDYLGATLYATNNDVLLDSGATGWTQPPDAPAIANSRSFRGSFIEQTATGTTYVSGFARSRGFREYRGLGWIAVVRQPTALAFAPARELQGGIKRWGLVFAAGMAIVSWLFAAQIARRMRSVAAAARRIRAGDILTVMPQPHNRGEFSQMCGALGAMVDDFRAKQETLAREKETLERETHPIAPARPETAPPSPKRPQIHSI